MEFEFDAFVSYRRSDGARVAHRLRRALLDYRLPPGLGEEGRVLSVYFDRIYERATDDFFEKTLKPALARSRHLVLVVTPDALALRKDGTPNWVEREVEYFLGLPQRENVHVVVGKGELQAGLPARLAAIRPNMQRLDLRSLDSRWPSLTRQRWRAEGELLALLATLHDVPAIKMPLLREEAARVKLRRAWAWSAGIGLTALALAGVGLAAAVGWWRAAEREAVASSQAMALRAESLKSRSMDRAFALTLRAFETAPTATAEAALRAHLDSLPLLTSAPLVHEVRALVVSAEAARVFTASANNGTRVAPVGAGAPIEVPGYFLAASADGTLFVTTRQDVVTLHRAQDGSVVREWPGVRSVLDLSGDGRRLAVRNDAEVRVLDVASGEALWREEVEREGLAGIRLSPKGDRLLLIHAGGTVRWLPVMPGSAPDFTVKVEGQPLVALTRDGELAAVGGADGTVVLVDTRLMRERWRGRPHAGPVRALHFSPDGGQLLSAGEVPGLAALDTQTFANTELRGALSNEVTGVLAWSPDGRRVLVAHPDGPLVLDYPQGEPVGRLLGHSAEVVAAAFSADGLHVTTAARDLTVREWGVADAPTSASVPVPTDGALQMFWLPGDRAVGMAGRRGEVVVWDGRSGAGRQLLRHGTDGVLALAAHGEGRVLAGGGHDGRVVAWALPAGRVIFDSRVSRVPIESIAFGRDSREVVVGDRNGEVRRCRLNENACESVARLGGGPIAQIDFDAALGRWRIASFGEVTSWSEQWSVLERNKASNFGLMRLRWHAPTGMLAFAGQSQHLELRMAGREGEAFHIEGLRVGLLDFDFSPGGDQIAVASASTGVRIWTLKTRQVATTLFGLKGSASSVAWSPDGKRIAAAGDGEAGLWDVATGALLAKFRGPFGRDTRVAFSADGLHLAIAGSSGRACIVALDKESLLKAARARAKAIEPVLAGTRWDDLWDFGPAPPARSR